MADLKTYSIKDDINVGKVELEMLDREIENGNVVVGYEGFRIKGDSLTIMGSELSSEPILDSIIQNHDAFGLKTHKNNKIDEIDIKTGELIALGFEFPSASGMRFSLSQSAQINISALYQSKDDPAITYPITYNTIDDLTTFAIPNAETLYGMYLTALATKKAHLDSGTALKNQVRAATTKAEVDLIIDNR